MCEPWRHSFAQFYADMGECPEGFTLERKDVDGDYEPSNCKWVPRADQASNKRNTLRAGGKTIKQIARERGINYYTLRKATKRGENPLTFLPRVRR